MTKTWKLDNWEFELKDGTKQIIIKCENIENNTHWALVGKGINLKNKSININEVQCLYNPAESEKKIDLSKEHIQKIDDQRLEVINKFAQAAGFTITDKKIVKSR